LDGRSQKTDNITDHQYKYVLNFIKKVKKDYEPSMITTIPGMTEPMMSPHLSLMSPSVILTDGFKGHLTKLGVITGEDENSVQD
jgi:hypothetical protein